MSTFFIHAVSGKCHIIICKSFKICVIALVCISICEGSATKGRKKLILTCLPDKVEMYKKFGFKNHEIGDSVWGGEAWHKMDIVLDWWISHD
ncbi:hypothetical protein DW073_08945 [Ruminococcus sp. AF45-4BH]|nr:hypothetical protein DW073_08945 [Ruminococcus sp. AF45-4BH]